MSKSFMSYDQIVELAEILSQGDQWVISEILELGKFHETFQEEVLVALEESNIKIENECLINKIKQISKTKGKLKWYANRLK